MASGFGSRGSPIATGGETQCVSFSALRGCMQAPNTPVTGQMGSALLCAGFLAGPPFEVIAGGCVMALLVGLVLLMTRDGL